MLKEEAMAIKESLQDSSLDQFRASYGWLDTWESAYAIKECRIVGELGDVAEETITSWMERIQELTEGYSSENIWNMDKVNKCSFLNEESHKMLSTVTKVVRKFAASKQKAKVINIIFQLISIN